MLCRTRKIYCIIGTEDKRIQVRRIEKTIRTIGTGVPNNLLHVLRSNQIDLNTQ